ncbi:MAG: hypothetical protein ACHQ53_17445 [Polyangiales bacterium]
MKQAGLALLFIGTASITVGCAKHGGHPSVVHAGTQSDMDASISGDDGATGMDGGDASSSGSAVGSSGASKTKPKSTSPGQDSGGTPGDASQPTGCALVACPAPASCGDAGGHAACLCPTGYHYLDVGGSSPPCVADDQCADCDAG